MYEISKKFTNKDNFIEIETKVKTLTLSEITVLKGNYKNIEFILKGKGFHNFDVTIPCRIIDIIDCQINKNTLYKLKHDFDLVKFNNSSIIIESSILKGVIKEEYDIIAKFQYS
jgi:hypothetical protein